MSPIPNGFRNRAISLYSTLYTTDEQQAMSSQEVQSALMLTVEFSKNHFTNFIYCSSNKDSNRAHVRVQYFCLE
jgi:hypothetical protein